MTREWLEQYLKESIRGVNLQDYTYSCTTSITVKTATSGAGQTVEGFYVAQAPSESVWRYTFNYTMETLIVDIDIQCSINAQGNGVVEGHDVQQTLVYLRIVSVSLAFHVGGPSFGVAEEGKDAAQGNGVFTVEIHILVQVAGVTLVRQRGK